MTELEKLARDICWAEFIVKPAMHTKATYWHQVQPHRRLEYIRDAEWLVFIVKKLKPLRILLLVDFKSAGRRSRRGKA